MDAILAALIGAILAIVGAPTPRTATAPSTPTILAVRAVDGDTIALESGERVRIIGIDTPERGQCGYAEATANMQQLVAGKRVRLTASARADRDRYGRLLRYVNIGRTDAGLRQIRAGLAVARYDSRDGYGAHPREKLYVRADRMVPNKTCETPSAPQDCMPGYSPCLPVVADLDCSDVTNGPITVTGPDPYRLDRDGDGRAC